MVFKISGPILGMEFMTPGFEIFFRLLCNTLLCKMEPGKMRHSEVMLLNYAVGDSCVAGSEADECDRNVNFGAIFVHQLVKIKYRPFIGTGNKTESVGSLLTPIFQHLGISTDGVEISTLRSTMDEAYLKHAQ